MLYKFLKSDWLETLRFSAMIWAVVCVVNIGDAKFNVDKGLVIALVEMIPALILMVFLLRALAFAINRQGETNFDKAYSVFRKKV